MKKIIFISTLLLLVSCKIDNSKYLERLNMHLKTQYKYDDNRVKYSTCDRIDFFEVSITIDINKIELQNILNNNKFRYVEKNAKYFKGGDFYKIILQEKNREKEVIEQITIFPRKKTINYVYAY